MPKKKVQVTPAKKISSPQVFSAPDAAPAPPKPTTAQIIALARTNQPPAPLTAPCDPAAKKFCERYRPQCLKDVVGQPAVRFLAKLAEAPFPCCRILTGPPGCGKTTAAFCLAAELGCFDEFTDLRVVVASDLTIDVARELWRGPLNSVARSRSGFKILVIEELERLSPQTQIFLKTGLETDLPPRTIVLATSNDTAKIDPALLQRFGRPLRFSGGAAFAGAAIVRLSEIWELECPGEPPPAELSRWGWDGESFSLRVALDAMQDCIQLQAAA